MLNKVYQRTKLLILFSLIATVIFVRFVHIHHLNWKDMQQDNNKGTFDEMKPTDPIICIFGAISDVQYADIPDGTNFAQTTERFYRNSLIQLNEAVTEWNKVGAEFVLDLGDVIDGFSRRNNQSLTDLNSVLNVYKQFNGPTYFQWGNHDFYNFQRDALLDMRDFNSSLHNSVITSDDRNDVYYHFQPCKGLRVISLDAYEISMLGRDAKDKYYQQAEKILHSKNKNTELNSPVGLKPSDVRFVKYNGGTSQKQLLWLDEVLNLADANKERVLITAHLPVYQPATDGHCLCWNYHDILSILHRHPSVAAYFAGHDHKGGYAVDDKGIHHMTFHGTVESPPGQNTFATVTVTQNGFIVNGHGQIPSRLLKFNRNF